MWPMPNQGRTEQRRCDVLRCKAALFPDERAGHGAEELLNFTLMKFEDLFPDDEASSCQ